ncbi:pseudouridine synthase [Vibrio makurazakiensis]|uniref:RluA family pseudouridine synthase n=1 Tax=Vibrio makurazakiensis TaxID=2910250 RepID=UPI003D0F0351
MLDSKTDYFTQFHCDVSDIQLPERFTFPYYYSPHRICEIALNEVQEQLLKSGVSQNSIGNMFGILVVENEAKQLGYLLAHSGELHLTTSQTEAFVPLFVPQVFNESAFAMSSKPLKAKIAAANLKLKEHQKHIVDNDNLNKLEQLRILSEAKLKQMQDATAEGKKLRKQRRKEAEGSLDPAALTQLISDLGNESSREKRELKALKLENQLSLQNLESEINTEQEALDALTHKVTHLQTELESLRLQHFQFSNKVQEQKSLHELLAGQPALTGTGECCAPKLLNYAYLNKLKPIAMVEFWWGLPPKAEIRQHGNLYPVCQSKCFEILEYMLEGVALEDNPLIVTPSIGKKFEVVYQDDVMIVVNKPAEFLSVPGKFIEDSVYTRIKAQFPEATGPLIVHRLDMSTSGLLVLALTPETNKNIQQQFINRTVEKRYTALLDGKVEGDSGIITLPLAGDINDRPRQLVCYENGRHAETKWQVIERTNNQTKVHLYPKTGRTHQLRVHCAHPQGLGVPITGDDLYGFKLNRLHLHAGYLKLKHPVSGKELEFEVPSEF